MQADEKLDSKPLIMHSGGEPAVRAAFVPLHVMTVLASSASAGTEAVATARRSQRTQSGLSTSLKPRASDRVIKAWLC